MKAKYSNGMFDVVIVEDETGGYVAFVPALPSCHSQGDTLGELMDDVKEAMELYLETLAAKRFLKLRHIFKKRDVNV